MLASEVVLLDGDCVNISDVPLGYLVFICSFWYALNGIHLKPFTLNEEP